MYSDKTLRYASRVLKLPKSDHNCQSVIYVIEIQRNDIVSLCLKWIKSGENLPYPSNNQYSGF